MIIIGETKVRLISVACKNRSPFKSINPHFVNPVFPYSLWTSFIETNHPEITLNEVKRATLRKARCRDKSGELKVTRRAQLRAALPTGVTGCSLFKIHFCSSQSRNTVYTIRRFTYKCKCSL